MEAGDSDDDEALTPKAGETEHTANQLDDLLADRGFRWATDEEERYRGGTHVEAIDGDLDGYLDEHLDVGVLEDEVLDTYAAVHNRTDVAAAVHAEFDERAAEAAASVAAEQRTDAGYGAAGHRGAADRDRHTGQDAASGQGMTT